MSTTEELRAAKFAFREAYGHVAEITYFGIGDDCLRIGVSESIELPTEFAGVRVEIVDTGDIRAQGPPA